MWHPLKRHIPSRVQQFSPFPYLCGSYETLSHYLKFENFLSSIVPQLFLSHPPQISRPPLSHFLSSTHQFTTFPSPSLFFFLSFPLSIIPFHSLLSFLSNKGVIKKVILNFVPTRSHQLRISIKVLSFLSFCVIDHPSPKNLLLLGFVRTLG